MEVLKHPCAPNSRLRAYVLKIVSSARRSGAPSRSLAFARDFDRAKRVLVPNLSDWTQTGKVLARVAAKYDEQIGRGRLTNDALIAISAGRLGITVITANARDFKKLAEFRSFQWQVNNPQST